MENEIRSARLSSAYIPPNTEYVPINLLKKYGEAEYLKVVDISKGYGNKEKLAADILQNGFREPLRMIVETWHDGKPTDPETARAYLSDGAHRLESAIYLGFTHVPIVADWGKTKIPSRFQGIPAAQAMQNL